ncbi:MAG TPA: hypothetical protein DD379_13905 [Cyanobacteria bacterium UBA11162]|nr:hypothetical protein [Cyanobacteria bacterium UBA11162]
MNKDVFGALPLSYPPQERFWILDFGFWILLPFNYKIRQRYFYLTPYCLLPALDIFLVRRE